MGREMGRGERVPRETLPHGSRGHPRTGPGYAAQERERAQAGVSLCLRRGRFGPIRRRLRKDVRVARGHVQGLEHRQGLHRRLRPRRRAGARPRRGRDVAQGEMVFCIPETCWPLRDISVVSKESEKQRALRREQGAFHRHIDRRMAPQMAPRTPQSIVVRTPRGPPTVAPILGGVAPRWWGVRACAGLSKWTRSRHLVDVRKKYCFTKCYSGGRRSAVVLLGERPGGFPRSRGLRIITIHLTCLDFLCEVP